MRQTTFIIYDETTKYIVDRMMEKSYIDNKFYSPNTELTESLLLEMANACMGEYFYVIRTDHELCFPEFNFSHKPGDWGKGYMHTWGNDTSVRLFNTDEVRNNPGKFTDHNLRQGLVEIKNNPGRIYSYPIFDIIFLSYDEIYANENYGKLQHRFPRIQRVHGVKGILDAHKAAAEIARRNDSDMFYVIDADADIMSDFNFDYNPHAVDRQSVHVWHSRNPVNNLEYGYGGVKLFPTRLLLNYTGLPIDFTTSVSKSFKVMPTVSNVTKFNTDPFSAWRSGFRECTKLASKIIDNQDNTETEERLRAWCMLGEECEFGDFAIMGAKEGAEFGRAHKNQPDMIGLINDFSWLEKKFNS